MEERTGRRDLLAVTRAAQHVWIAAAFVFIWLHFTSTREHVRGLDWQLYSLYFLAIAGISFRYLTGIRHGHRRWHRVVFDGLSILFIALGVNLTGGIRSDLWLVYFIFIIAETLAASARGFLLTDAAAIVSYVIATWPQNPAQGGQQYAELLVTRIFFLVLVASIARTLAAAERSRQEDLAALREALSVSEERRRLARDLHDGVGHALTRVILSLEVARRQVRTDPEAAETALARQADELRSAMEEMRQLVATLRTDTARFDLASQVRFLAAQMSASGSLDVRLEVGETPLPLSPHRQYHLSRVIQEALTNCMRHSGSPEASVQVGVVDGNGGPPLVRAIVSDRGKGFDPRRRNGAGYGLRGMAERLEAFGGRVSVESTPGSGTRVLAEIPADTDDWAVVGQEQA